MSLVVGPWSLASSSRIGNPGQKAERIASLRNSDWRATCDGGRATLISNVVTRVILVMPMLLFSQTADRIAATTKKLEKTAILADYFRAVAVDDAAVAAVFFSGRPVPVWEETTLQVGGSMLWRIVAELAGKSEHALTEAYRKHGDLGAVAEAVLPQVESQRSSLPRLPAKTPAAIQRTFREISTARRPAFKAAVVRQLLEAISPLEAKYVIKVMTGDLRIGLKESLV